MPIEVGLYQIKNDYNRIHINRSELFSQISQSILNQFNEI